MNQSIKILRRDSVLNLLGVSKSTLGNRINDGLFPPSISLGGRAKGWLESEVISMLEAYATGKDKDELQLDVMELVKKRSQGGF